MPDLSAYINFSVTLDYTQNKFVLNDTSTYPGGVETGITGIFDITHPDLIREDGVWATPDIIYSGASLTTALRTLRRNSTNKPQTGSYTIKYTVDHAGYTPTTLSRTFTFDYVPVTASITENFDVFTPNLNLVDATVYTKAGYTTASTVRAWSIVVGTVGTVTGSTSTLSLAISGSYYDATYVGTLASTVTYTNNTLTYLSVKDIISGAVSTKANTPPDTCSLLAYLTTIKSRLDLLIDTCQPYDTAKKNYEYASDLYFHILERLKAGSTSGVIDYVTEFLTIYFNATPPYINTNTAISPYVFCYAVAAGDITKYFVTMSVTATSFTNATFSGKSILLTASEGMVLRDTDISLAGSTITKTNSGDEFVAGTWYLFLLKEN